MKSKWIISLVVVAVVAAGAGYYHWSKATALPDWYTASADELPPVAATPGLAPPNRAAQSSDAATPPIVWTPVGPPPPPRAPDGQALPKQPREVRNFHLRSAAKNPALRKAVQGSRATYEDGTLEAGVVINLSKIPRDKLSTNDRKTFDRAMKSFPPLRGRDVYVGLEDRTVTRDGILQLGPSTKIKIGKLSYSLDTVAKRLGLSAASIRRQINRELRRLEVRDPEAPVASGDDGD